MCNAPIPSKNGLNIDSESLKEDWNKILKGEKHCDK